MVWHGESEVAVTGIGLVVANHEFRVARELIEHPVGQAHVMVVQDGDVPGPGEAFHIGREAVDGDQHRPAALLGIGDACVDRRVIRLVIGGDAPRHLRRTNFLVARHADTVAKRRDRLRMVEGAVGINQEA